MRILLKKKLTSLSLLLNNIKYAQILKSYKQLKNKNYLLILRKLIFF